MEVLDGAHLEGTTVYIGWPTTQTRRHGEVVLRSGAALWAGNGGNGGFLEVGGTSTGKLTVAEGADFRATKFTVSSAGVLGFEFGADSVSTMVGTASLTGSVNQVDGLLRLDLGALETAGTYVLIDSQGSQLSGALRTWLDAGGGSRSGTGDVSTANFEIADGGDIQWELATDGQNLTIDVIPEPVTLSLIGLGCMGLFAVRRLRV